MALAKIVVALTSRWTLFARSLVMSQRPLKARVPKFEFRLLVFGPGGLGGSQVSKNGRRNLHVQATIRQSCVQAVLEPRHFDDDPGRTYRLRGWWDEAISDSVATSGL
jgi:hypothetical protein